MTLSSSLTTLNAPPWPVRPAGRRSLRFRVQASWVQPVLKDEFGGWYCCDNKAKVEGQKGWNKYVFVGFGASVMIVLAGLGTYHSFQTKGFNYTLPAPIISFYEKLNKEKKSTEIRKSEEEISKLEQHEQDSVDFIESQENLFPGQWDRYKIAITVPTDTAQQNALSILKKLQIIENDATGDELCTRREFARWFVKLNSSLERNKKHKIIPNLMLSESIISAFNDIKNDDPDFWCIQLLGEIGLVPSNLSNLSDSYFLPESYLSRFDLLNIKALIERPFTTEIDKKSR